MRVQTWSTQLGVLSSSKALSWWLNLPSRKRIGAGMLSHHANRSRARVGTFSILEIPRNILIILEMLHLPHSAKRVRTCRHQPSTRVACPTAPGPSTTTTSPSPGHTTLAVSRLAPRLCNSLDISGLSGSPVLIFPRYISLLFLRHIRLCSVLSVNTIPRSPPPLRQRLETGRQLSMACDNR